VLDHLIVGDNNCQRRRIEGRLQVRGGRSCPTPARLV
jgi:hypothetical protein